MKRFKPITKMYPLTKLILALVIGFTSVAVNQWQFGYFVVAPMMFILAAIDGHLMSYTKKVFAVVIIFFSFIFLIQAFLVPQGEVLWEWFVFTLTRGGLHSALTITGSVLAFLTTFLLVFETTDMSDLMVTLQKTGLPSGATYVFLASLQMIPELNQRSKTIMQAQRARGIETEGNIIVRTRAFLPTLSPLIISSISDIADKAATLEARGFSSTFKRTYYRDINARRIDIILPILITIFCILYILWVYVPAVGALIG